MKSQMILALLVLFVLTKVLKEVTHIAYQPMWKSLAL
jgi:hypothetical protein